MLSPSFGKWPRREIKGVLVFKKHGWPRESGSVTADDGISGCVFMVFPGIFSHGRMWHRSRYISLRKD